MAKKYLAIDFGASSGRHIIGSLENGKMSCTVTANEGEKLFLILPRTMGWNTYVNGEKTAAEDFAYCLTVIPLKEGENRIERFYRVPNLRRGIALTIAGILFLAAYELAIRKIFVSHRH